MIHAAYNLLAGASLLRWEVICLGLAGVPGCSDKLATSDVASFAMRRLEFVDISSPQLARVVALATERTLCSREALQLVEEICAAIDVDKSYACRCWRYGLLMRLLGEQYDDPVYGSISLEEFILAWAEDEFGAPLPTFAMSSPEEYLSEAAYVRRLGQLREWSHLEAKDLEEMGRSALPSTIA